MEFTPLRIKTIKPATVISFDLYIFFKDQYLKYRDRGITIPPGHHQKLLTQKIAKFYITAEDETNYQQYLDLLLNQTLIDPNISTVEKVDFVEESASTAVEQMKNNPRSETAFRLSESSASNLRQVVNQNSDALLAVYERSSDPKDQLIKHSINVCALATKFATQLKCKDEDINHLATAALLHDLGLGKLNPQIVQVGLADPKKLSPQERLSYYNHPRLALDLLQGRPYINPKILHLVLHHEENRAGSGPEKNMKPTQVEEILALVDCYDKKISFGNLTPKKALKELEIDEIGNYDLNLISKLKTFLKEQGILKIGE